jgi:Flp pilus assembly pilin Flp
MFAAIVKSPRQLLDKRNKQAQTPCFRNASVPVRTEDPMNRLIHRLWREESGQDIAEYAVMLAVILVLVVGTIRLIGGNANNVFSQTASSISQ